MRSAILCGREHARLGAIDLIAEGPVAIAISLGGASKVYPHTDPNEDAALFAVADGGGGGVTRRAVVVGISDYVGTGSDLNIAASFRSSLSFSLSAIFMIFDVKTIPDLFFAAKDYRLDGSDRHIRSNAYFPVRQPAGIRENHYRSFFLRQDCKKFVEV